MWLCGLCRFHFTAVAEANGAEGEGESNVLSVSQLDKEQVAMKEYVGQQSLLVAKELQPQCALYTIACATSVKCCAAGAPVHGC